MHTKKKKKKTKQKKKKSKEKNAVATFDRSKKKIVFTHILPIQHTHTHIKKNVLFFHLNSLLFFSPFAQKKLVFFCSLFSRI